MEIITDIFSYQRAQVWVGQDVAIISNSKRIAMDAQL